MQQPFPLLKFFAWNQTMHVHMRAAAMLNAVKPEAFHDRGAIFSLEATDPGAGMIHEKPADDVVLVA